jgi:hypothetical protein
MSTAGKRRELARYQLPTGPRVLYAQRVNGHVAIADVPEHDHGRVYLIERHIESQAAMTALVADYLAETERRGEPAARIPRELRFDDTA